MDPVEISVPVTKPRLRDDTKELAIVAKKQTANDLKRLMHISDDLAAMNYERFQAFNLESRSNSAKPAGLAFDGDVYWGLKADSLSETALAYAQDHLRIISGLYGVLRPMDAIQPYRLEMGTKMANGRGKSSTISGDRALQNGSRRTSLATLIRPSLIWLRTNILRLSIQMRSADRS